MVLRHLTLRNTAQKTEDNDCREDKSISQEGGRNLFLGLGEGGDKDALIRVMLLEMSLADGFER